MCACGCGLACRREASGAVEAVVVVVEERKGMRCIESRTRLFTHHNAMHGGGSTAAAAAVGAQSLVRARAAGGNVEQVEGPPTMAAARGNCPPGAHKNTRHIGLLRGATG